MPDRAGIDPQRAAGGKGKSPCARGSDGDRSRPRAVGGRHIIGEDFEGRGGDRVELTGAQREVARDVQDAAAADVALDRGQRGRSDVLQREGADVDVTGRDDQPPGAEGRGDAHAERAAAILRPLRGFKGPAEGDVGRGQADKIIGPSECLRSRLGGIHGPSRKPVPRSSRNRPVTMNQTLPA